MRETIQRVVLESRQHTYSYLLVAITVYFLITPFLPGVTRLFLEPGSFSIPEDMLARVAVRPHDIPISIFAYFSFVTLATLGYGDVTPIGAAARTFSSFEAVVGQLFIAITIARLVGLRVAESALPPSGSADQDV